MTEPNNPEKTLNLSEAGSILLLSALALWVGWMTWLAPWLGDELLYSFIINDGDEFEPVRNFSDIITSQNNHYLIFNGRYLAHVIVQSFCGLLGRPLFVVCAAGMWIALVMLILREGKAPLSDVRATATIALLSLLSFQTKMTPSCLVGYIWTGVFSFLFIRIFFSRLAKSHNGLLIIIAGAYAFIAGNGQESINIGICGALIMWWLRNRKNVTPARYVLMIMFVAGTLSDCLSPGTIRRFLWSQAESPLTGLYCFCFSVTTPALAVVMLRRFFRRRSLVVRIYKENSFWFDAIICLTGFVIMVGYNNNRQIFGIEMFAMVILLRVLKGGFSFPWLGVTAAATMIIMTLQADFSIRMHRYYNEIERQYAASANGEVYLDMDLSNITPSTSLMSHRLSYTNQYHTYPGKDFNQDERLIERHLELEYPGRPRVRIKPKLLRNMHERKLASQIREYTPGLYIVIIAEGDDPDVEIRRELHLPGITRQLSTLSTWQERPVDEGANWKAYIVGSPAIPFIIKQTPAFK